MVENNKDAYWPGLANSRGFYRNAISRGENCRELVNSKALENGMEKIDQMLDSSKKKQQKFLIGQ